MVYKMKRTFKNNVWSGLVVSILIEDFLTQETKEKLKDLNTFLSNNYKCGVFVEVEIIKDDISIQLVNSNFQKEIQESLNTYSDDIIEVILNYKTLELIKKYKESIKIHKKDKLEIDTIKRISIKWIAEIIKSPNKCYPLKQIFYTENLDFLDILVEDEDIVEYTKQNILNYGYYLDDTLTAIKL